MFRSTRRRGRVVICSRLEVLYGWLNLIEPREEGNDEYQNETSQITKVSVRRLAATARMQRSVEKVKIARQVVCIQKVLL